MIVKDYRGCDRTYLVFPAKGRIARDLYTIVVQREGLRYHYKARSPEVQTTKARWQTGLYSGCGGMPPPLLDRTA